MKAKKKVDPAVSKACAKKAEDPDMENQDTVVTDDEDNDDETDLEKSLANLEAFVQRGNPESRKQALSAKFAAGTLTKSEQDEFVQLIRGDEGTAAAPDSFVDDLTKGLNDNPTLQKSLEVSEYLEEQHHELVKSLSAVGKEIEAGQKVQGEFNMLLAKSVFEMGKLVKSLSSDIQAIGSQAARGPKSLGVSGATPMIKSFAGQTVAGPQGQLTKAQVLDAMEGMLRKSIQSPSGENLNVALTKYEQFSQMSPAMEHDVRAYMSGQ